MRTVVLKSHRARALQSERRQLQRQLASASSEGERSKILEELRIRMAEILREEGEDRQSAYGIAHMK